MIALPDLIIIANDRLSDAEALYFAGRYSAAAYLSGYAIEVSLKHKICITLNWSEFPQTNAEFKKLWMFENTQFDCTFAFFWR